MIRLYACAIVLALGCAPAAAETRWTMVRNSSMTVIGDESADTLRDVAVQMEQFRTVIAGLIPNAGRPPSLPTIVFVFGKRKDMKPFLPVANGHVADVAGYFQRSGDANSIVMSLEDFEESAAVVYHEYTHLLIANAVRSIPVWLNEGLAEYYSSYTLARDGRTADIGRPLPWRLAILRERYLPLAEIIAVDSSAALHDATTRRTIFYAESWALTHYLLSQVPNGGAKINQYAAAISEGRSPSEAFYQAFGATPAEFDKQLVNYVRRPAFLATRYVFPERIAVDAPQAPRAVTAAEADAWLGDLQRRIDRAPESVRRIEAAAAAAPDSAATQLALGLLRMSQDRTAEGVAALEQARALAPDDFVTQFLHGVSLLRAEGLGNPEFRTTAASSLKRAVSLRGGSSDARAWLAYAQMLSDDTLADARTSILGAIALAPGRIDFKLRYADICILQGNVDEARTLLTAISNVTFDAAAADSARARLAAIDRHSQAPSASRSIETSALEPRSDVPDTRVRLRLRPTQAGEQRVRGLLTQLQCSSSGVRFDVATEDGSTITASTTRMEQVELISYLDQKDFAIACGARTPPDRVYLTFREETTTVGANRTAVAVEFLPKNYIP